MKNHVIRPLIVILIVLAAFACSTGPPGVSDRFEGPTQSDPFADECRSSTFLPVGDLQSPVRFDSTDYSPRHLTFVISPDFGGEILVPRRITYVPADQDAWNKVIIRFLAIVSNGAADAEDIHTIVLGPFLFEQFERQGFFETHQPQYVIKRSEINGIQEQIMMAAYNRTHRSEGFQTAIEVLANEIAEDRIIILRNATPNELDWYWTYVSWDIREPVFVIDNTHHSFFIDMSAGSKSLLIIDDMRGLTWCRD